MRGRGQMIRLLRDVSVSSYPRVELKRKFLVSTFAAVVVVILSGGEKMKRHRSSKWDFKD